MRSGRAAAALVVALSCSATAQVAILQIQIIEGEGGVYAPGSRSTRPLTVEVTDETGRPVAGAAVSFHLPENGPTGTFPNGLRTDVVTTDERGRASLRAIQLNRVPGRFAIRVVASKEQARAGTVSFQYIAGVPGEAASSAALPAAGKQARRGHGKKWIAIAAIAGGGAAAGLLAGRSHSTAGTTSGLTIGAPSLTVSKP